MEFNVQFKKDELRKAYETHRAALFWRTVRRAGICLVAFIILWRYLG